MAEENLQTVRDWLSNNNLGEFADLFVSNGFDSVELLVECVDKELLEEQFSEEIFLPGKRQQLLLAIRNQKEGKTSRIPESSMYDWFQEHDIGNYFNAFVNKGYDNLEVIIETINEDVLLTEFSAEIPLLGQRKKVALAVRKAKENCGTHSKTIDKTNKPSQRFLTWTDKALGEPWKKKSLGYIPFPKGERSKAYMELLPKFYKAVKPFCSSEKHFREQFMIERSRQYETNQKVMTIKQKLEFKRGDNQAACGKFFDNSYILKASDVAVLSKHLEELDMLKSNLNKLKDKIVEEDQSVFDKSGRRVNPQKSIHHDFNSATLNKLHGIDQELSAFMSQVNEKLHELQITFKGMAFKPSTSKARKRKQNKRKSIKRKLARMENSKARVMLQVFPRVDNNSMDISIEKKDILIEGLLKLSKVDAKILQHVVKSDERFSDDAKAYLLNSLTETLSSSGDSSDTDSNEQ